MLSLCFIYFVVTGLNYWATDYILTVFQVEEHVVQTLFAIVCVTGPICGVILGGMLTTRVGGYTTYSALKLLVAESVFLPILGLPIAFMQTFKATLFLIWLILFIGGMALPNLMGIMLSVVEDHEKTTAFSVACFAFNAIGFIPAPFLYGVVSCNGTHSRAAFFTLMVLTTPFFGCVLAEAYFLKKTNIFGYEKEQDQINS